MFCMCMRSCACADDTKIMHSRDAQYNNEESTRVKSKLSLICGR